MGQHFSTEKPLPLTTDQNRALAEWLAYYKRAYLQKYQNGAHLVPVAMPVSWKTEFLFLKLFILAAHRTGVTQVLVALNMGPFRQRYRFSADRFGLQPFMVLEHHQL